MVPACWLTQSRGWRYWQYWDARRVCAALTEIQQSEVASRGLAIGLEHRDKWAWSDVVAPAYWNVVVAIDSIRSASWDWSYPQFMAGLIAPPKYK